MGNAVFSRRWAGNPRRGHSQRFRPRLESLERRLHLAADFDLGALDLGPLAQIDAARSPEVAVVQRNVFVQDEEIVAVVDVLETHSPRSPSDVNLFVEIVASHQGEWFHHPQFVGTTDRSPDWASDIPSPSQPTVITSGHSDQGTLTLVSGSQFSAANSPLGRSGRSNVKAPPPQVVATRYSTELTSDSIDFTANELAPAELEASEQELISVIDLGANESTELLPIDIDTFSVEASELPHDGAASMDLDSDLSQLDLPVHSMDASQGGPEPMSPQAVEPADESQSPSTMDVHALTKWTATESPDAAGTNRRFASPVSQSTALLSLTAAMPEYAWMDIFIGAPIGRLSVLNGFDVFRELQNATADDSETRGTSRLSDAFNWGVLVVGSSVLGMVILRTQISRKRIEAKDIVFGSSMHLEQTLSTAI